MPKTPHNFTASLIALRSAIPNTEQLPELRYADALNLLHAISQVMPHLIAQLNQINQRLQSNSRKQKPPARKRKS